MPVLYINSFEISETKSEQVSLFCSCNTNRCTALWLWWVFNLCSRPFTLPVSGQCSIYWASHVIKPLIQAESVQCCLLSFIGHETFKILKHSNISANRMRSVTRREEIKWRTKTYNTTQNLSFPNTRGESLSLCRCLISHGEQRKGALEVWRYCAVIRKSRVKSHQQPTHPSTAICPVKTSLPLSSFVAFHMHRALWPSTERC